MNLNIKEAYKKLKGFVYYDKNAAYFRTRIAEFEKGDFEKELDRIEGKIVEAEQDDFDAFLDEVLNSINVITFPKNSTSVASSEEKDAPSVISISHMNEVVVSKYNNFIDINIAGMLLGIIWVTRIGYEIDKDMGELCYGNRIRDNLILDKGKITASPNLFYRYFDKYKEWRDKGLKKAHKALSEGSVVITMLDLTRYFYNIDVSKERFNSLTQNYITNDPVDSRINNAVLSIMEKYSEMCGINHTFLPIGFPPSGVLANAYIHDVDTSFEQLPGTIYYGRYVDDIMWIKKIDSNKIRSEIETHGEDIISQCIIDELKKEEIVCETTDDENRTLYYLNGYDELQFNANKLRFFYLDVNGGKHLLSKITEDINSNTSGFNLIPTENVDNDFLMVNRTDTVNKIRGISNIEIDKYELSKSVGKRVMMSPITDDETQTETFLSNLDEFVDGKELIANYSIWENIINYCLLNDRKDYLVHFIVRIIKALTTLDEETGKNGVYSYLNGNSQIMSVKDSLIYHLVSCVLRCFSVFWEKDDKLISTIFQSIGELYKKYSVDEISDLRKQYLFSRMYNKSLVPIESKVLLSLFDINDIKQGIKLFDINEILNSDVACDSISDYFYLPYVLSPFEIGYSWFIWQIKQNKVDALDEYIKHIEVEYQKNFQYDNGSSSMLEDVIYIDKNKIEIRNIENDDKSDDITIAVSNAIVSEEDLYNIIDYKPGGNRTGRFEDITHLTNIAIKQKANVLVFPETYIPKECINILGKEAQTNQIMIIGGLEYIVIKGVVWNFTCIMVPFKYDDISYVIPFFKPKISYAPSEKLAFKERHFKSGNAREKKWLFRWRDFDFVTYCCFELSSLKLRSKFLGAVDVLFAVEFNPDIEYFSNIVESLSRDMFCYVVQVNASQYGDSRMIQPKHSYEKNLLRVSGGKNATALIGKVDIKELNEARKAKRKIKGKDHKENTDPDDRYKRYTELPAKYPHKKI